MHACVDVGTAHLRTKRARASTHDKHRVPFDQALDRVPHVVGRLSTTLLRVITNSPDVQVLRALLLQC